MKLEAGKGNPNSKEAFPGRDIHEGAEWSCTEQRNSCCSVSFTRGWDTF